MESIDAVAKLLQNSDRDHLDDFMGKSFTTGPDGKLYRLPDQQFANLYWFRYDWFQRPELKARFREKYGYELGVPANGPAAVYAIRKWDEWLRKYAPPGAASYDFYQSLPAPGRCSSPRPSTAARRPGCSPSSRFPRPCRSRRPLSA